LQITAYSTSHVLMMLQLQVTHTRQTALDGFRLLSFDYACRDYAP